MFDRFTNDARKAMGHARQASIRLGHGFIDGAHILLGLLEVPGPHHEVLQRAGTSAPAVKQATERKAGTGLRSGEPGQLPFTPGAKEVLQLTLAQVVQAGEHEIGPEHLLLGLLDERDEIGGQVLREHGVCLTSAQDVVFGSDSDSDEAPAVQGAVPATDLPGLAAQVFDVLLALRESKRAQEEQAQRLAALQSTLRRVWIAGLIAAGSIAGLGVAVFLR